MVGFLALQDHPFKLKSFGEKQFSSRDKTIKLKLNLPKKINIRNSFKRLRNKSAT